MENLRTQDLVIVDGGSTRRASDEKSQIQMSAPTYSFNQGVSRTKKSLQSSKLLYMAEDQYSDWDYASYLKQSSASVVTDSTLDYQQWRSQDQKRQQQLKAREQIRQIAEQNKIIADLQQKLSIVKQQRYLVEQSRKSLLQQQ